MLQGKLARWIAWALFSALVLAVSACGGGSQGTSNGTVTVRSPDDYDTIDPGTSAGTYLGYQLRMFLYDRLVEVDDHGNIVPHLATSWDITPTTGVFHVHTDATCSDGTKLTPSAMAASITRLGDPATKTSYAYRTFGSGGLASATGDDANGTVTVNLKAPYSDMLLGFTMWWTSIICPAGLSNLPALKDQAFGSGPYKLSQAKRGDSYTLARRSGYTWGPQGYATPAANSPATVVFKVVTSESTAANLILSGGIQMSWFTGVDTQRVAANKSFTRYNVQDNGGFATQFNEKAGLPGADMNFRKAIEMAIDPKAYNQAQTFGNGNVYKTLYSPNLPCYNEADGAGAPPYDVSAAKVLLTQAGWAAGSDGKLAWHGKPYTIRLIGYTDEQSGPDYILTQLQQLGFNATLRKPDLNGWIDIAFTKGDWDITPYPFSSAFPSPGLFRGQLAQASITNPDYFNNAKLALSAAPADKCKYWDLAEAALINNYEAQNLSIPIYAWFGKGVTFIAPNNLLWPTSLKMS